MVYELLCRCLRALRPFNSVDDTCQCGVIGAAAVTRSSSVPVSLIVPANTESPTALSTGMLSPVTGA